MAWDVAFDFRATQAFVTDPAGATYVVEVAYLYPITRTVNGVSVTFGWEDDITNGNERDRSSSVDARLAGIHFATSAGMRFRVDLPAAGDYEIHCALGDPIVSGSPGKFDFKDGTTTLFSVAGSGANFADATGSEYSAANWPGSEAGRVGTFGTTIFRLASSDASTNCVAHLRIVQSGGGAPAAHLLSLLGVGG